MNYAFSHFHIICSAFIHINMEITSIFVNDKFCHDCMACDLSDGRIIVLQEVFEL